MKFKRTLWYYVAAYHSASGVSVAPISVIATSKEDALEEGRKTLWRAVYEGTFTVPMSEIQERAFELMVPENSFINGDLNVEMRD